MIQVFRGPHVYHEIYGDDPGLDSFPGSCNGRIVVMAVPVDPRPPGFHPPNASPWMHGMLPWAGESGALNSAAVLLDVLPQVLPPPWHAAAQPSRIAPPPRRPAEITSTEETEDPGESAARREASLADPARPAALFRKLFPEPGLRRIVHWGEFKEALAPQLADPQRLRDPHRLLCYVQVYEATAVQRWGSLAAAVQEEAGTVSRLQLLTVETATKLQLLALLRARPRPPHRSEGEPERLLPQDLVFRLHLAHDPTVAVETQRPRPQPARAGATAPASPPPTAAEPSRPQGAIPECFVKPWEFRVSREEALYDMSVAASRSGWLGAFRRLRNWLSRGRELRKWRVLLCGKSLQEQLWAVRPPLGGLAHPAIREWARATLERAGYDPQAMLAEWEIFWRRKGL